MANQIPYLNDYQGDNYPVIYDEGDSQLKYVKEGNKVNADSALDINGLSAAGALDGTEEVPVFQDGANKKTTTQDIADLGGGSLGYLVYTAILSQSGEQAPEATILKNTLSGTPAWSRTGVGNYKITLAGAFTANKTYISGFEFNSGIVCVPISNVTVADYYYFMQWLNVNEIILFFTDASYSGVEMVTALNVSNKFCLPEIRVYP